MIKQGALKAPITMIIIHSVYLFLLKIRFPSGSSIAITHTALLNSKTYNKIVKNITSIFDNIFTASFSVVYS